MKSGRKMPAIGLGTYAPKEVKPLSVQMNRVSRLGTKQYLYGLKFVRCYCVGKIKY